MTSLSNDSAKNYQVTTRYVNQAEIDKLILMMKTEYNNVGFITKSALLRDFTVLLENNDNNDIIAFILYTISNKNKWVKLSALVVDKKYRRKGFGKSLILFLKTIATVLHLPIRLNVAENVSAFLFFEKEGFQIKSQSDGKNKRKRVVYTMEWMPA